MGWWDYTPLFGGGTDQLGNGSPSATRQQQRDEIANESQGSIDKEHNAPAYTGPAGQGYIDSNGNVTNTPGPGKTQMQRPGIDSRLQGNLENPYAGYYGGAPGVAQSEEQRYAGLADAARNAPGAQINNGQYNQDRNLEMGSRGNQDYALGQYQNMIQGKGPSIAEQQMRRGIAMSNAQQQSIMAGARGGGAGLAAAQQAGANAAANASGNVIGQMGSVRAQEQLGALQGYAGLATQQRAADLQRQGLSADQAYRQAQLEETQHQINATTGLGYEGLRQGVFQNQQQGMEYNESENQNAYMGGLGIGMQQSAQNQQQQNNYIQGALAAAGAVGTIASAASDVRGKKDIGDGRPAVQAQMGAMSPQAYQYKDPSMPGAGPGQRVGVMAQDMERGPYGHQLVKNTPTGKKIDGPGGLSLALASGADHEQRLRALEHKSGVAPGMPMYGAAPAPAYLPADTRAALSRDAATRNILATSELAGRTDAARRSGLAAAAAQKDADRTAQALAAQQAAYRNAGY